MDSQILKVSTGGPAEQASSHLALLTTFSPDVGFLSVLAVDSNTELLGPFKIAHDEIVDRKTSDKWDFTITELMQQFQGCLMREKNKLSYKGNDNNFMFINKPNFM